MPLYRACKLACKHQGEGADQASIGEDNILVSSTMASSAADGRNPYRYNRRETNLVATDSLNDPNRRVERTVCTELINDYGGETNVTTISEKDNGQWKPVRKMVVKFDQHKVVRERTETEF